MSTVARIVGRIDEVLAESEALRRERARLVVPAPAAVDPLSGASSATRCAVPNCLAVEMDPRGRIMCAIPEPPYRVARQACPQHFHLLVKIGLPVVPVEAPVERRWRWLQRLREPRA